MVGLRSAHSLAVFLGVALEFLQKNVWILQPGIGDMWDRLLGLKKGDVVVGFSFPRYTRQTIEVLRFAKDRGLKTLAITDTLISPLAQYADHVLTARYRMDSFIESFTAPLSLINAVVTALGVDNPEEYPSIVGSPRKSLEKPANLFPCGKAEEGFHIHERRRVKVSSVGLTKI